LATGVTLSNGNLDLTNGASNKSVYSTIGVSSGKWYYEVSYTATGSTTAIGIGLLGYADQTTYIGATLYSYSYDKGGNKINNNSGSAYGASYTNGDIIGVAFDADAGTLTFYKNNTSQGVAFSGLQAGTYFFGASSYEASGSVNFGQRPFAYTAPSGFKALCTQNLPTPTIGATSATLASQFFAPVLFTGTGATQTVNVGFETGLLWGKERSGADRHWLADQVRGLKTTGYYLLTSNNTDADTSSAAPDGVTAITSTGFTLGANTSNTDGNWSYEINASGSTYVAWNWKANGSGSSNTAGSITSTVSANTTAGFSIVRYSGNATSGATVGHGLGVAPSMVIGKTLNTAGYDWPVYHVGLTDASYVVSLNLTNAQSQQTNKWNSTAPTSTVVTLGDHGTNVSGTNNQILYCFAPIAGYSAFGSYTGNGSADGPFVYTGFKPAFILYKRTSSAGNSWRITDSTRSTYNLDDTAFLYPDSTQTENTNANDGLDILSNGFKMRTSNDPSNNSGSTYIYMAFASSPFKYSLAR
jgi:hypothetical protein